MVHGHFDVGHVQPGVEPNALTQEKINMGIAIVVPFRHALEVISTIRL